jgi:hypothetical protein
LAKGKKTGGRKAGVPNRRTVFRKTALSVAAAIAAGPAPKLPKPSASEANTNLALVSANNGEWHGRDAHSLLRWIYCNPDLPLEIRADAAKSAIRFEKPSLVASHVSHSSAPSREMIARMTVDQIKALLAMDADSTPLIEVDRQDEDDPLE